ncbi:hypothetical protein LTR37_006344 [Vermiconidia calcicola]|uniref:Uncharacterized protein n=1 Tax=Vermiconidia calcicola TaxID=1690605 RepID=A0ACC3NGP4_9PEZI|nr:hypothetical protein LTR37_006344 [Vermiconidia calcicola]
MSGGDNGTKADNVSNAREAAGPDRVVVKVAEVAQENQDASSVEPPLADEFGLPIKPPRRRRWSEDDSDDSSNGQREDGVESEKFEDAQETPLEEPKRAAQSIQPIEAELSASSPKQDDNTVSSQDVEANEVEPKQEEAVPTKERRNSNRPSSSHSHGSRPHAQSVSEWSHQALAPNQPAIDEEDDKGDNDWQEMPAFATHRIYDDWGKVLAKEYAEVEDEHLTYATLGGAGKGYTRVQVDDDAQSATSLDDNTAYLFKEPTAGNTLFDEDEQGKDLLSQMQTTKELLTEGQRIAYVGIVRLSIGKILDQISKYEKTKGSKKAIELAMEGTKMWGQKMMVRLYGHMEIDSAEQVMVEQLAEHGVLPADLAPALMQNARVKNPAKAESETNSIASARPSMGSPRPSSSTFEMNNSMQNLSAPGTPGLLEAPPAYEDHTADQLTVRDPSQIESTKNLDIDIRWTILCDLFLLLIADSSYDARSRTLLEYVGGFLSVDVTEVCRFEKRVTDALEMQEQADKENWNEDEHLASRKKSARNKRLMVMGLCTVGGGLVIGLSAGLLAPVIGAGLAAGFTTIGVAGTSTFLGGTGAAALIGTAGTLTGSAIAVKASDRRTGAVKTFEYRPLFNNKRTNLIVTVSGWMTGNVDDVRLPFSTVDPIMGDVYSVNWEPDMLRSTGQTIQILATEALTQTIQQILGSTLLTALMAGLSVPIVLTKLSYLIDNPWTVSLARADATGLILADSIVDRNLGVRPITLVGFSLGSRVIFSCLKELAKKGALGLVQNVYLFGSPIVAKKEEYLRARTVVSGRFLNGYATNDWILGYLFRATGGGIMRVSGLGSVDVPGIENKDVTELVPGHMAYRGKMPALLQEVGWLVDGLEFSEIEDPDPEDHQKRQRQLMNEIEAARYVLEEEQKGEKKTGLKAFFSRKKAVKKDWETYDERSQKVLEGDDKESQKVLEEGNTANVMFDVDAIRQEALKLALQGDDIEEIKKHLSVREIQSTLPALKVASAENVAAPKEPLRQTRSYDETTAPSHGESRMANGHARENAATSHAGSERASPGPSNGHSWSGASSPNIRPDRPPLKSATTAPQPLEVRNPSHNPWADEDEEFGREKQVQMTFE